MLQRCRASGATPHFAPCRTGYVSVTSFPERRGDSLRFGVDRIIGLSDGLTVPFALTAGLSSLGSSKLVYIGGLAEIVGGAFSMGVG
jgi:hypothetical protein